MNIHPAVTYVKSSSTMNWVVRQTFEFGYFMWELALSATCSLMFVRRSHFSERAERGFATHSSTWNARTFMKPFAGIGIALFLLVSIGGEALMTVRIFRHELSVTTLPAKLPTAESELAAPPRAIPMKHNEDPLPGDSGRAGAQVTRHRSTAGAIHTVSAPTHPTSNAL
jgi:hypothetical protein